MKRKTPGPPRALEYLAGELEALEQRGLLRAPERVPGRSYLVLCANDYLGYAGEPLPGAGREAGGAGGSRLISGDRGVHDAAERSLAAWIGTDAALLFSSGYAANVGAISALAGPED